MRARVAALLPWFALARRFVGGAAAPAQSADLGDPRRISGYGNFHAAGIVATVAGDTEPERDPRRSSTDGPERATFRTAQPLIRISTTTFTGSLFHLAPGGTWEARVTLTDPDGTSGTATQTAVFTTRSAILAEPTLQTLYVAPGGDDGGPGTQGQPLATIQEGANRAAPGTLVSIAPGDLPRERGPSPSRARRRSRSSSAAARPAPSSTAPTPPSRRG